MLVFEGIGDKPDFDGCESGKQIVSDEIFVFFSEAFDHVLDISWGMFDYKRLSSVD